MLRKISIGIVLLLSLAIQVSAGGKCTDIAVNWTLYRYLLVTDPSSGSTITKHFRIYGAGTPAEITFSGTIKRCSSSDAVLIASSTSKLTFNFTDTFLSSNAGSPSMPLWVNNGPFDSPPPGTKPCGGSPCVVLNVRNILGVTTAKPQGETGRYTLLTQFGTDFVAPDLQSYNFSMRNPDTIAGTSTNDAILNSPSATSRVVVEHFPAGTNPEYWWIYPETQALTLNNNLVDAEVGTLIRRDSWGVILANYGEFSMPFCFKLTVK